MKNARRFFFLDVDFFDHPKVLCIGPIAGHLFLRCLAHAAEFETDGFIAKDIVERFRARRDKRSVNVLLNERLLHRVRGGFQIDNDLLPLVRTGEKR